MSAIYSRTQVVSELQRRSRQLWIVLPAFNEEQDLPRLLRRIEEAMHESNIGFEILVVDDGSTDQTFKIADQWSSKLPLRVMKHSTNEGLGATLRDGLLWASKLAAKSDVIVTLDADNSHTPELMVRMLRMIREGHDVVVASRYRSGSRVRGVPLERRVLSILAGLLFKILFPIRGMRDYTSGYRAYRAEILQHVIANDPEFFDQDGFQVMVDVLLKLRTDKTLIFGEVPLILRYDDKKGASKMNTTKTAIDTLRLLIQRRF